MRRLWIARSLVGLMFIAIPSIALVQEPDHNADLEQRVAALEERVAFIPLGTPVPGSVTTISATGIEITGIGDTVSEPFELTAGTHRVQVVVEPGSDGGTALNVRVAPG